MVQTWLRVIQNQAPGGAASSCLHLGFTISGRIPTKIPLREVGHVLLDLPPQANMLMTN